MWFPTLVTGFWTFFENYPITPFRQHGLFNHGFTNIRNFEWIIPKKLWMIQKNLSNYGIILVNFWIFWRNFSDRRILCTYFLPKIYFWYPEESNLQSQKNYINRKIWFQNSIEKSENYPLRIRTGSFNAIHGDVNHYR